TPIGAELVARRFEAVADRIPLSAIDLLEVDLVNRADRVRAGRDDEPAALVDGEHRTQLFGRKHRGTPCGTGSSLTGARERRGPARRRRDRALATGTRTPDGPRNAPRPRRASGTRGVAARDASGRGTARPRDSAGARGRRGCGHRPR